MSHSPSKKEGAGKNGGGKKAAGGGASGPPRATAFGAWLRGKIRHKWKDGVLILVAVLLGLATWFESGSQRILGDLRTEMISFRMGETPGRATTEVGFDLDFSRVEIRGECAIRYHETNVAFSSATSGIQLEGSDHAAVGKLLAADIPPGADVRMSFSGDEFALTIDPGARAMELKLSVPAGWRFPSAVSESGEIAWTTIKGDPQQPVWVVVSSRSLVSLTCRLGVSEGAIFSFAAGVPTSRVRVSDLAGEEAKAISRLFAGRIRFLDLKDREVELWLGERFATRSDTGHLLAVECVGERKEAGGGKGQESEMFGPVREPHLHVVWEAEVTGLKTGHSELRSVMPSWLAGALGTRGYLDYLAISTGCLALLALLLNRSEKEIHLMKESQHAE